MDALLEANAFIRQGTIIYDGDNHSVWYRRSDAIVIIDHFTFQESQEIFDYSHLA